MSTDSSRARADFLLSTSREVNARLAAVFPRTTPPSFMALPSQLEDTDGWATSTYVLNGLADRPLNVGRSVGVALRPLFGVTTLARLQVEALDRSAEPWAPRFRAVAWGGAGGEASGARGRLEAAFEVTQRLVATLGRNALPELAWLLRDFIRGIAAELQADSAMMSEWSQDPLRAMFLAPAQMLVPRDYTFVPPELRPPVGVAAQDIASGKFGWVLRPGQFKAAGGTPDFVSARVAAAQKAIREAKTATELMLVRDLLRDLPRQAPLIVGADPSADDEVTISTYTQTADFADIAKASFMSPNRMQSVSDFATNGFAMLRKLYSEVANAVPRASQVRPLFESAPPRQQSSPEMPPFTPPFTPSFASTGLRPTRNCIACREPLLYDGAWCSTCGERRASALIVPPGTDTRIFSDEVAVVWEGETARKLTYIGPPSPEARERLSRFGMLAGEDLAQTARQMMRILQDYPPAMSLFTRDSDFITIDSTPRTPARPPPAVRRRRATSDAVARSQRDLLAWLVGGMSWGLSQPDVVPKFTPWVTPLEHTRAPAPLRAFVARPPAPPKAPRGRHPGRQRGKTGLRAFLRR